MPPTKQEFHAIESESRKEEKVITLSCTNTTATYADTETKAFASVLRVPKGGYYAQQHV